MRTFFLAPEQWASHVELEGSEAHHMTSVLRLKPGETVCLIDGHGREGTFRILSLNKKRVELENISETIHAKHEAGVTIAVGWCREVRRSWLLEKSVELEADAVWFFKAERSQFALPDKLPDAWQASLIAGAKQCHNPWIPGLRLIPSGISGLIQESTAFAERHVLAEPSLPSQKFLSCSHLSRPGRTLCVIGPEGGFAPAELEALQAAGFQSFSLGGRILRWETAALMALGLHWWKRQNDIYDKL